MRINILRQSKGGGGELMVTSWMYMGHGLLLDGWIWDMGYCYMDVYGTWVTVTWCPNFPLLTKSGKKIRFSV